MNVVDSSGWLEYLAGEPGASFFAPALEDTSELVVPSLALTEVFRKVLRESGETAALQVAALMQQGTVVELDANLAILAARLGVDHKLPLADSVILATARVFGATVWTQDADFEGLDNVRYQPKRKRAGA